MFFIGMHRVCPIDVTLGMTGMGKEQIGIMFEHAETGERITWYGYFTDGTFERTLESLRYLGWQGTDLTDFLHGLPESVGNEVDIVVEDEQDERDGTMRRKVRWVNSGSGVAVKDRLSDEQARSFAARMKQRIAASQANAGVKSTASRPAASKAAQEQGRAVAAGVSQRPQSAEQHFNDDDIPF